MTLPWSRRAAFALCALAFLLAGEVAAYVPPARALTSEWARANRGARRAHSLVLSVVLKDEHDRTLGRGELLSDPSGLARLDVDGERHLLRGGEHLAARGDALVRQAMPILPPLFFLQAADGERLRASLVSLGGSPDEIVLGRFDGQVCYVLGGRDLPPPANDSASLVGSTGRKAAVWITREGFRVARIDRLDGTRYSFGPERSFADLRLPGWIRIERPGLPTTKLEVVGARRGRFDRATTFGMDWLLGR